MTADREIQYITRNQEYRELADRLTTRAGIERPWLFRATDANLMWRAAAVIKTLLEDNRKLTRRGVDS